MKFLIIRFIFSLLSILVPPKKGLFIFGSWFGTKYGDNSKAFFEFMSDKQGGDNYWFTKNRDVASRVRAAGYRCIHGVSLKNIILHLRAEAVFCNCSVNSDLLGQFLNRKTKVFNLWHGTPIKKIGKDAIITGINRNRLGMSKQNFLIPYLRKMMPDYIYGFFKLDTYYLASSVTVASILQQAMALEQNKIIICGYPKLDRCFKKKCTKKNNGIKILYAPTYRGEYSSELDILTTFGFNIETAKDVLCLNNATLTVRLHPANKLPDSLLQKINSSDLIYIDNSDDIYESLGDYSLVITDFSSIYFDALAIGVDVMIAPFGFENYIKNDRNLYFSLEELYPNNMPYDWNDFFEHFPFYVFGNVKDLSHVRKKFYDYPREPCSKDLLRYVYLKLDRGFVNEN
ncbi:CDP-glycerol glycerophosphotransferase family protein [Kluyvera georgiana]|uniref:CDP-glycerol glycerophosphotransferase family protein n=1 Tax=Kluyvera georgiana TaxID=73098 RepID=UPI0009448CB6|nr:CDP-glycerol glycerophosphotransferase family protein [Kluyvera georgiana]